MGSFRLSSTRGSGSPWTLCARSTSSKSSGATARRPGGCGMTDPLFWRGKRVLLTGNTGFKGSWLSIWLEMLGAEVTGFALPPPTEPSLFALSGLDQKKNWIEGDVRDRAAVLKAVQSTEPEIVFHLAAQPLVRESYVDPVGTYATNVMGTVHVLDAVRQTGGVRAIVNVTTDKCYENQEWAWGYRENEPMGGYDPYSNSKGCSELVTSAYRRSYGLPLASARAGNVIGGGDFAKDRLIPDILRAVQAGEKVKIRSPLAIRPWQHVLEPLSGYLTLAESLYSNPEGYAQAWNFGPHDDDAQPVEWIVKTLCRLVPESQGYEVDQSPQPHEAHYLKLDISKAKSLLGWSPRWSLSTALAKIVEWNGTDGNASCRAQIAAYGEVPVGS
uniref:RfbG n=1 Tax=Spirochaeta aurantia TaxID=147 RepID=Q0PHY1_SPIAU|nr:RfbG [Spirochaeta aurantia]